MHGNLVLEFSNYTSNSIRLHANSKCSSNSFFKANNSKFSADRAGKYQGQTGITLAKSK